MKNHSCLFTNNVTKGAMILKYTVIHRGDHISCSLTNKFHQLAARYGLYHDDNHPRIVLSIGGDGTMLQAFHQYSHVLDKISFVGIHTGHLGFYADWKCNEIELLAQLMAENQAEKQLLSRTVKYPLIELQLYTANERRHQTYIALNEFTLKGIENTLMAQININNELFELFRGDGICISTPSGSTAYNKSIGGAIVHPSISSIQLTEIASINNHIYRTLGSSLILPKHHHCTIYPKKNQNILLTIDHINIPLQHPYTIRCQVAKQKITFIRYRPFPFWNRVRTAFLNCEERICDNIPLSNTDN